MRSAILVVWMSLVVGCGTTRSGGSPMPDPEPQDVTMAAPPAGAEPETWIGAADGTTYVLTLGDGSSLVTTRGGVTRTEPLQWDQESAARASPDGVTADVDGTSCVEVVGVDGDAMLVKVGVLTDGRCVLSDTVLRFARQTQR